MFSKKAQIEIQFNWIFVLIAGVVFLSFFLMLIANQSSTSEQKISVSLTRHFKTILDSTSHKSGTFKEFNFPAKFKTEFVCDLENNLHYYELEDVKVSDLKYDIIFAPNYLYGQNIYTWTKEWAVPDAQGFSVSNFLFVSNKARGYIFRNSSSDTFRQLYDFFPSNLTKLISDGDDFLDRNFDFNTYILTSEFMENNNNPFPQNKFANNDYKNKIKFIIIHPYKTDDIFNSGEICFCNDIDNCWDGGCLTQEETFYLGEESLYGALFTSDYSMYTCMMHKAFQKLKITSTMHYYWIEDVILNGDVDYFCKTDLEVPLKNFGLLADPKNERSALLDIKYVDLDKPTFEEIASLIKEIHNKNQVLALGQKCIQLY